LPEPPKTNWNERRDQWLAYVESTLKVLESGRSIPLGPSREPLITPREAPAQTAPVKVLIASPHPDDEALIGALPLRLRREAGARVVDCAITLGSDVRQRPRRLAELQSACRVLDFELVVPLGSGFDRVTLQNRHEQAGEWRSKVAALKEIFDREKPDAVFAPHAEDFNTAHVGTHYLVQDALGGHLESAGRGPVVLIETEFWHEHSAPNLMIGVSPETLAIQIMATAEHGGEVSRNPYHLRLPARMMDNVRRGSEVVGGQGAAAQPFAFAELYRVVFMKGMELVEPKSGGRITAPDERIDPRRLWSEFWPGEA
jgi:N-acetylglucosamine malate deacetylase 1